jgi:hypothetical protein
MRKLVDSGWTFQQIGDKFGISRQRAHQLLRSVSTENNTKRRQITDAITKFRGTIRSMHANGYLFHEIAEAIGVSVQTMSAIKNRMRLKRPIKRITHGTRTGYCRGCRCEECRAVTAKHARESTWAKRRAAGVPQRIPAPKGWGRGVPKTEDSDQRTEIS